MGLPVPEDVLRVHLNFQLGVDELAVTTFHLQLNHGAGQTVDWPTITGKAAQKVADKWRAAWGEDSTVFGPQVSLRDVSAYHLRASDGLTLDKATYVPTSRWGGVISGSSLPNECSLAVTLYGYDPASFVPDRRRRRGRMYLPPMSLGVMTAGQNGASWVSSGAAGDVRDKMANFLNDVHRMTINDNSVLTGGDQFWSLGVLSRASNSFHRVEAIGVGQVMDVQKRRRNKQNEGYLRATIQDS